MRNKNNMSDRIQQVKTFVTGLVVGSTLGAGAALLNAPQSGKKTRKKIRKKAAAVQTRAEATVDGVRDKIQGAEQITTTVDGAQARLNRLQKEFRS